MGKRWVFGGSVFTHRLIHKTDIVIAENLKLHLHILIEVKLNEYLSNSQG